MKNTGENPQDDEFERLMGLLALSSQALPEDSASENVPLAMDLDALSEQDKEYFYAYLDNNPDAFAQYIHHHHPVRGISEKVGLDADEIDQAGRREPKQPTWRAVRYRQRAILSGLSLVLITVALASLFVFRPTPTLVFDQSFAQVENILGVSIVNPVMPWQRGEVGLGFSASASADESVNVAFTLGLISGLSQLQDQSLSGVSDDLTKSLPEYLHSDAGEMAYRLGQWNILLTAAGEYADRFPNTFWKEQLQYLEAFNQHQESIVSNDLLNRHLAQVGLLLNQLHAQEASARAAANLVSELELYREATALKTIEQIGEH